MKHLLYILPITILLFSCDEAEPVLENEELIFSDSYAISIPEYEYTDLASGNNYLVRGDSGRIRNLADTLSATPVFIWKKFNYRILTIAIFDQPIEVQGGTITNTDDVVWQWHTGMEKAENDTLLKYSLGKDVIDSEIMYDSNPTPLASGNYFWAIWGWSSSGTRIIYSSMPFEFYVL